MFQEEWFIIKDFEAFINATRAMVFNNFGQKQSGAWEDLNLDPVKASDQEELEQILSYSESTLIAKEILKKQKHKSNKNKIRYLVSESNYLELIDALNNRMVGNILNNLVNKGLVETSFDEEANDFIFWVKDETNKTDNPETD